MERSENWYKQFSNKLELNGMSPRTYTAYSRAVRLLKDYCNKDPWEIFKIAKFSRGRQLPSVLTREEVTSF